MSHEEAFIYDAVRTPRGGGKANGALHTVKPVDLVARLSDALFERNPNLDAELVDDVVLGIVSPVGDQGSVLPRTSALLSKLGQSTPGVQINRYCASGLEALNLGAQKVRAGWEDLVVVGGVEAMSRVPLGSDGGALFGDPATSFALSVVPQGVSADLIATMEGFDRETVDAFAADSQDKATTAWKEDRFAKSIIPVRDSAGTLLLDRDEHIRPGSTVESLGRLKPSFALMGEQGGFDAVALQKYVGVEKINHVHHAGNSSGIVDGATLILIGNAAAGTANGLTPRGRVVSAAVVGTEPTIMLTGPTPAANKALAKAGLSYDDIDIFEVNEAFASVVLKFIKDTGIDPAKVNPNGGSIAMGHPLGATGSIIIGTALDELERTGGRYALATLCVGGGMGIATVIERI